MNWTADRVRDFRTDDLRALTLFFLCCPVVWRLEVGNQDTPFLLLDPCCWSWSSSRRRPLSRISGDFKLS